MIRSCIECGALITSGSRCRAHTPRPGPNWQGIRSRILERDGHRCTWIVDGQRCTQTTNLQVDHIIPQVKGGTDVDHNLRVLCRSHNSSKRDR